MSTTRETILKALLTELKTISGPTVLRGDVLPERVPSGGLIILRDGNPGDPEVTMSPLAYYFEHRAEIEVIVQGKTPTARATAFDTLVANIATALGSDRTLGGLCDWTEAHAPEPADLPIEGGQALKAATIPVTLTYTTVDSLG